MEKNLEVDEYPIKKLTTKEHYLEAYSILNELRTNLTKLDYLDRLETMVKEGYQMYALYDQEIVALAGIAIRTNFYCGKHLFIYDLVTSQTKRSKGYGENLLRFIEELASEEKCEMVTLESGLQRQNAHRFYENKMGFAKSSYSFRKHI